MKIIAVVILCITQSACGVIYDREPIRQPALINVPETYTKSEIDAINAETMCKAQARTQLQLSRCGIRR